MPLLPLQYSLIATAAIQPLSSLRFFANYGFHPFYLIFFPSPRFRLSKTLWFLFIHKNKLCQEAVIKAQVNNKREFDKQRRGELILQPGDRVWLRQI